MIDRPPKRCEITQWPDPAAAGSPFEYPFPRMGIGCLLARFCHGGLRLPAADEHLPQFPPQKLFGGAMRRAQRRLNAAPGPPACGL